MSKQSSNERGSLLGRPPREIQLDTEQLLKELVQDPVDQSVLEPSIAVLEITLNFPRTTSFKNACTEKQKKLYDRIWRIMIHSKGQDRLDLRTRRTFELCNSGHVHLHGILYLRVPQNFYINGLIADLARTYLSLLPKKFSQYHDHFMFNQFNRYRCPSIVIQYDDFNSDQKRIMEWETYIDKNKSIVIV